jgi:hypothetical protein
MPPPLPLAPPKVVHQLKGERSYHIFYQLVRGANQEERKRYCLPTSPSYFNYLKQSGCMEIEGVDDASDLRAVQSALCDVGVDPLEQQQIFSLLSGGCRGLLDRELLQDISREIPTVQLPEQIMSSSSNGAAAAVPGPADG